MRKLIEWLYKRFPPTLTVTLKDYTELRQEVADLNRYVQGIQELNTRLITIEKDVRQLNQAQGFIQTPKGAARLER